MQRSTTNEPTTNESQRMTPAEINATPGARHFKQEILPGFGYGPILPVWLSDRLHKLLRRTDTHIVR